MRVKGLIWSFLVSSAGFTSIVLTPGLFLDGIIGKPRSKNSDRLNPIFFHSSPNVGGSFILLGWTMGGLGGSWPGYCFPLNPWNSGNLLKAVMRMMVLNKSLKPMYKLNSNCCVLVVKIKFFYPSFPVGIPASIYWEHVQTQSSDRWSPGRSAWPGWGCWRPQWGTWCTHSGGGGLAGSGLFWRYSAACCRY